MSAWVTLLTNADYLPGLRVLQRSLTEVGSSHPLEVMITAQVDEQVRLELDDLGLRWREVAPLAPPGHTAGAYAAGRFDSVWTKLAVWSLTDHERVVFLDSDMLVLQPMDELFDLDLAGDNLAACHACRCNPLRIESYPPDWRPENCFYTWCDRSGRGSPPPSAGAYFNSGAMVLQPSETTMARIVDHLQAIEDLSRYPFPEQDLLNEIFDNWVQLPWYYNALKTLPTQHPQFWRDDQVRNLHYILDKPWQTPPAQDHTPFARLNSWWWRCHGRAVRS